MSAYARILFISAFVPLILAWWKPLGISTNLRNLGKTIGWVTLIFSIWDILAVSLGHWSFDQYSVWPIRIINLPIEEILFFILIPFCCIFTWEVSKYLANYFKDWLK